YADRDWSEQDRGHAAMITRLDAHVGRLLNELRVLGLEQNTLVLFSSDNGPHNESGHTPARFQPAGPFSGLKRSLTDGGIRVPCLAWWPGTITAGTVSDRAAYFGDVMATAAELAGCPAPSGTDSLSLVPVLKGQSDRVQRHEFLYWEFHEGGFRQACLYAERWKAIRRLGGELQLFDTASDVAEKMDVAAEHPEIAARVSHWLDEARSESPDWVPRGK
ncbi:MAG: sulfatase-like hydrolase/transferase, partial [Planctomycetaceae bacterium]